VDHFLHARATAENVLIASELVVININDVLADVALEAPEDGSLSY